MIILLMISVYAINVITGLHISTALTKPQYINVQIAYGDTLWDIAADYKSDDTDIRKAVYDICKVNDMNASELEPGMTIKVPELL